MAISLLGDASSLSGHATSPFGDGTGPPDPMLEAAAAAAVGALPLGANQRAGGGHQRSQSDKEPASAKKPGGPGGPSLPCGGGAGGSAAGAACASGGGSSHGMFMAMLLALGGFAVLVSTLLRLPPARWRPAAFIALLERPG
jgi:hypothetical protein